MLTEVCLSLLCTCAHCSQHHGVLSQVSAPDHWHPEWIPDLFVKQRNESAKSGTDNLSETESTKLMRSGSEALNGLLGGGKQGKRGIMQEMVANAISNYLMMGELLLLSHLVRLSGALSWCCFLPRLISYLITLSD